MRPHRLHRPSLAVALVALVVALTALTAVAIGGLAWREQLTRSRAIVDAASTQAARLAALHARQFLLAAETAAAVGPQLVAQGQLDPRDDRDVERFVLSLLRSHRQLTWVSYSDRGDRFIGAWRDGDGEVYVNRSFPRRGRIRLEEDWLVADGATRVRVRSSDDHGYRPSRRPHFLAAVAKRGLAWTEPYTFYGSQGLGITCAAPVLDARGDVSGVFTVDFSLDRVAATFDAIQPTPRGRVFLAARSGRLLVTRGADAEPAGALHADLVQAIAPRVADDAESSFELEHDGERYVGRAVPLRLGDHRWLVQVVVPERDYTEDADAQARRAVRLGALAVGLALAGGVGVARWIARPLRTLAEQAQRIRRGDLDVTLPAPTADEIGVLTRSMRDMAQALRDRDFVREALGRYVSPELAERFLRDRDALRLGGELRQVTILMSDLRGFSTLSERLGPEAMIDIVNRYLGRMTPVILAHGGMINEFIGDAILVLFGAPFERPDDGARAVRCAWAMQRAMDELNAENRALGLPVLAMGIGVHAGVVVAGNLGSKQRLKYGVVGPAVNLTARVQALAAGGQVLLTQAALARGRGAARVGPPWQASVKGVEEPVSVQELLGVVEEPAGGAVDAPISLQPEAAGRY
jgi:sigma-B regulation protein RsbU (phosphoserine phosphatase)